MSGNNGQHAVEARRVNDEIEAYEERVNKALRKKPREAFTTETALEKIFASEESPRCPHCAGEIEPPHELEEWGIRNETIRRLSEFVCQDGLEPWKVLRNIYAVFAHMSLEPWSELTLREKALMLGDSHGAQHFRIEKLVALLRRAGAASFKAPGQKQIETRGIYSECQQGNTNRRRQHRPRHRHLKEKQKKQKQHEKSKA
jgi:hypothetical protein